MTQLQGRGVSFPNFLDAAMDAHAIRPTATIFSPVIHLRRGSILGVKCTQPKGAGAATKLCVVTMAPIIDGRAPLCKILGSYTVHNI